ncbi:MAG: response regulator [Spirochaetaceae bacterium]|nr:MAG: response regulator [Spirochaetaceae bacterium]
MTFIVLEESVSVRHLLCYLLLSLGIKGLPHESKEEALKDVNSRPDIGGAIIDIDNKKIKGLEFIKELQASAKASRIKIIVHTIQSHRDTVTSMAEMGVEGFLLKPFHEAETFKKLKNIISHFDKSETNQRKHIRVIPHPDELMRVHFKVSGHPQLVSGKIVNISMGGLAIELVTPAPAEIVKSGTAIPKIQFSLFGSELSPNGEIIMRRDRLLGIRFESLSSGDSIHLAKYIFDRVSQDK